MAPPTRAFYFFYREKFFQTLSLMPFLSTGMGCELSSSFHEMTLPPFPIRRDLPPFFFSRKRIFPIGRNCSPLPSVVVVELPLPPFRIFIFPVKLMKDFIPVKKNLLSGGLSRRGIFPL